MQRSTRNQTRLTRLSFPLIVSVCLCIGCQPKAKSKAKNSPAPKPIVETIAPAAQADAESHSSDELQSVGDDAQVVAETPANDVTKSNTLAEQRDQRDSTVWKNEVLAQEYERALVRLWDRLLQQDRTKQGDKFDVLASLNFASISLAEVDSESELDHGIRVIKLGKNPQRLTSDDWKQKLANWKAVGYRIVQSEWHHARFDPPSDMPAKSVVSMALYLERAEPAQRVVVQGNLQIQWQNERDESNIPVPQSIDATDVSLYVRDGTAPFVETFTAHHATPKTRSGVQPVITQDLDGDGLSEIILGGSNEIFWNRGDMKFEVETMFYPREQTFETGIVADFNGDQLPDYVTAGVRGDLLMFVGRPGGRFRTQPLGKAKGGGPLRQPQVITAGDVDNDGDLDLWIAQYKISYVGGQMPSPYYDANDGFPAFLLLNDGKGRFQPATEEAGLAEKRYRRTYGSCFIDLDEDADLDLLVVSDFSGIDVYYNDGTGYFTDVTDQTVDERHIFGMSATFGDYDLDGKLDFFVSGMASTTARRLEYMRLGRRDRPDIHMMRSRMAYGNRMYLTKDGQFQEPIFRDQVARTGWAWGATSFDFDNDGDKDIFVANGHSSGKSTKDHCSHFWCHDIYDGASQPNLETAQVFKDVLQGYFDRSESWDGYQKNALLMNQGGQGFTNVGFLLGVGHQYDGRAVIGEDLDGDGRVDLLVVEDQWRDGQILHVYQNQTESDGHWIGVRFRHDNGSGRSAIGARVAVKTSDRQFVDALKAGDSIHAQHSNTLHFGLGRRDQVQSLEIVWPDGTKQSVTAPEIDQYHDVVYTQD